MTNARGAQRARDRQVVPHLGQAHGQRVQCRLDARGCALDAVTCGLGVGLQAAVVLGAQFHPAQKADGVVDGVDAAAEVHRLVFVAAFVLRVAVDQAAGEQVLGGKAHRDAADAAQHPAEYQRLLALTRGLHETSRLMLYQNVRK